MRSVREWVLSDLEALCVTKAEESSGLEFKRSMSLLNTSHNKEELCKDVSAMANAAGGIIVYGIAEGERGEAGFIDDGCDPLATKPEWIDQVLTSGVEPAISGVIITSITLDNGNRAFAIEVPQATTFAPHQVRQKKLYYGRTNSRIESMLDYEIRDLMRRSSTPDLYLEVSVHKKDDAFFLRGLISNHSSEPALYSLLQLTLDNNLEVLGLPDFEKFTGQIWLASDGVMHPASMFTRKMGVPAHFPVFKEVHWDVFDVQVRLENGKSYVFTYMLRCPGFHGVRGGIINFLGDMPHVEWSANKQIEQG